MCSCGCCWLGRLRRRSAAVGLVGFSEAAERPRWAWQFSMEFSAWFVAGSSRTQTVVVLFATGATPGTFTAWPQAGIETFLPAALALAFKRLAHFGHWNSSVRSPESDKYTTPQKTPSMNFLDPKRLGLRMLLNYFCSNVERQSSAVCVTKSPKREPKTSHSPAQPKDLSRWALARFSERIVASPRFCMENAKVSQIVHFENRG